jgi:tetratricopeptide (TPR) repeat protein
LRVSDPEVGHVTALTTLVTYLPSLRIVIQLASRAMSTEVHEPKDVLASPLALHLLGILHAYEGRYEEAEEAFLRAVEAEPEMAGSCVELGLVYACRGDYWKMAEALGRAVEIGAGGVRAYLGEQPLGDVTAASSPGTQGRAAAGTEGESGGVHTLLTSAMSHLSEGRDEEAAELLERALEDKAGSPRAAVALLALTYLLRGDGVEADEAGIRRVAAAEGQARRC